MFWTHCFPLHFAAAEAPMKWSHRFKDSDAKASSRPMYPESWSTYVTCTSFDGLAVWEVTPAPSSNNRIALATSSTFYRNSWERLGVDLISCYLLYPFSNVTFWRIMWVVRVDTLSMLVSTDLWCPFLTAVIIVPLYPSHDLFLRNISGMDISFVASPGDWNSHAMSGTVLIRKVNRYASPCVLAVSAAITMFVVVF